MPMQLVVLYGQFFGVFKFIHHKMMLTSPRIVCNSFNTFQSRYWISIDLIREVNTVVEKKSSALVRTLPTHSKCKDTLTILISMWVIMSECVSIKQLQLNLFN